MTPTQYSRNIKYLLFIAVISCSFLSCKTEISGQYHYTVPPSVEDGLLTASIHETDLDTTLLFKLFNRIQNGKYKEVHSVLIYKDGKLVVEEYYKGHDYDWEQPRFWGDTVRWNMDRLHNLMSDTKSITSALIGIAIDKGFIKSEKESIFNYLPEYRQFKTEDRARIKIEHLLSMTSGFEGNEWTSSYRDLENPIIKLWFCQDPIECILDRPVVTKPGTYFSYWGGNNILLGEILQNATGLTVEEFSREYLFKPLAINDMEWATINDGPYDAAGGLKLSPRSMLKIGILFLKKGKWESKEIISEDWVQKSATTFGQNTEIKVPGSGAWKHGYSFSWWIKSFKDPELEMFFASGWGGQNIMIIPDRQMVVIFTGGNYTSAPPPKKIMDKYIIPAMK